MSLFACRLSISVVILATIFTLSIMAQEPDIPPVCITTLHPDSGKVDGKLKTKVKKRLNKSDSDISYCGDLLISSSKLVKNVTDEPRRVDLPVLGRFFDRPEFSNDGRVITYWDIWEKPYSNTLRFFDTVNESTSEIFIFTYDEHTTAGFSKNPDASLIVSVVEVSSILYMSLLEKKGSEYVKTDLGKNGVTAPIFVSTQGDRVFYKKKKGTAQPIEVYLKKTPEGWSPEIEILSLALKVQDELFQLETIGIAENGRTRILKSPPNHFSVTYEVDRVWSEPEYVGLIELNQTGSYETKTVHSEDGRVIVVEQPKEISPDYGPMSWDIFVFLRDTKGQWSKHQINSPDVGALGDVLLSGNGQKLFWTPERSLSAVRSEDYK